ncbi:MAG: trypsin-like peptidase domain-containing protein [Dehalococcoidia bacterium]|jgi:2-alkenal reductase|nr:trypsin-like peptidase domain-containing protein [Dehalococcoidia bacterium]
MPPKTSRIAGMLVSRKALTGWTGALLLVATVACSSAVDDSPATSDAASAQTAGDSPTAQSDSPRADSAGTAPDTGQPIAASPDEIADDVIGDAPENTPANLDQPGLGQTLTADEIAAAFESVIGRVFTDSLDSVVEITVSTVAGGASGSGFVWDDQNRIVTNQHVIADAERVEVTFSDGRSYAATVLGEDPDADVAVLQAETDDRLKPIALGDSDTALPGQIAIAIGNPFGEEFTLTQGIVSAVGRSIRSGNQGFTTPDVIQTDAAINPGNSGGPLLNRHGEVIGINAQIRSDSRQNSGVGFAVPINIAKMVVPDLIEHGEFVYSWLGVSGHDVSRVLAKALDLPDGTRGAYISQVIPDGPAEDAGLNEMSRTIRFEGELVDVGGDTVVGVDGTPIRSMADLISYLTNNTRPGDIVMLEIIEYGGDRTEKRVELGVRP